MSNEMAQLHIQFSFGMNSECVNYQKYMKMLLSNMLIFDNDWSINIVANGRWTIIRSLIVFFCVGIIDNNFWELIKLVFWTYFGCWNLSSEYFLSHFLGAEYWINWLRCSKVWHRKNFRIRHYHIQTNRHNILSHFIFIFFTLTHKLHLMRICEILLMPLSNDDWCCIWIYDCYN